MRQKRSSLCTVARINIRKTKTRRSRHWIHLINFYNGHQTMLKSSLLLLVSMCLVTGIQGFGYTSPDVIYALENSPLGIEIECGINDLRDADGLDSSSLFFNESCYDSTFQVFRDKPYIEILSKDKIKLKLPKSRYSKCNYTCQLLKDYVAYTSVYTGKPLGKVKNFQCRDQDWDNMTCVFTEMDNNIPMKYELTYKISNIKNHKYTCNLKNDFNRGRICEIYSNRDAFYKNTENYTFTLISHYPESKYLSSVPYTETFEINHLAVVIPSAPKELLVTNVTTDSATITWQMPSHIYYSSFELVYDLQIKSHYDTKWRPYPLVSNSPKIQMTSIENLEYAYCDYDVRLRIKTRVATDDMYSPFVHTQFKTSARRPDRPPRSTFGAFVISDSDSLTIFWEQLDEAESNGPNLRYTLTMAEENEQTFNSLIQPDKIKNMSAKFDNLSINDNDCKFTIKSTNDIGNSSTSTEIFVPRKTNLLKVDLKLTRSYENNEYKLQWHYSGADAHLIKYFTIFSCQTKSEQPNDCDGKLIFRNISALRTTTIYPADSLLNFAISANSHNSTTGMIWTECLTNEPDEIGKATTVYVPNNIVDEQSFVVRWHVDCRDLSIIKHFQLEFCPVALNIREEGNCIGSSSMIEIFDTRTREYQLSSLRPYMNYKISLRLISISNKTGNAVHTYERTKEAAPTPPKNLRFSDVTNSSVALTWDPPESMNGVLQYYRIFFVWGGHSKRQVDWNQTSYVLTGLHSYTKYEIIVMACTVQCSIKSNSISIETKIGAPSQIQTISNDINGVVMWSKPIHAGGNLDYYELRITSHSNGTEIHRILRVRGELNKCQLEQLKCQQEFDKHTISVRGVNLLEPFLKDYYLNDVQENDTVKCEANEFLALPESEKFHGPWSVSVIEHYCNVVSYAQVMVSILVSLCVLVVLFYGFTMLLRKIKQMSDIKICLPNALEAIKEDPGLERKNDSEQMLIPREVTPRISPIPNGGSRISDGSIVYEEVNENENDVRHSNSQQPLLLDNLVEKSVSDDSQKVEIRKIDEYVPMSAKILKPPQPTPFNPSNGYVPIKKGIGANGYVKNVVSIPIRDSFKDLHKNSSPVPIIKNEEPLTNGSSDNYTEPEQNNLFVQHQLKNSPYVPYNFKPAPVSSQVPLSSFRSNGINQQNGIVSP